MKRLGCLLILVVLLQGCGGSDSEPASFLVSVSANAGGSVSPMSRTVASGQSTSFSVQPNAGYELAAISGCGGQLNGSTYTTGRISANCTISARFEMIQYEVTTSVTGEGHITPDTAMLAVDEQVSFQLEAATGHELESVSGCGGVLDDQSYLVGPLTAGCTIDARFMPILFELTASSGSGGSVSPASQTVQYGDQAQFTVLPQDGFRITDVAGCPGELRGTIFTTEWITSACDLTVEFEPDTFTITTSATAGGRVTPEQAVVQAGEEQVFMLEADDGHRIGAISGCDGVFDGERFIISPVSQACQLTVQFSGDDYVYFSDDNLAAVVRQSLGLATDAPVPADALAGKTYLYAGAAQIERLDGLQYATGLTTLELHQNELRDISLLQTLGRNQPAGQGLRDLRLSSNSLQQLPDLSALQDLQSLQLAYTKISDVSALSHLSKLQTLSLLGNDITDIAPLSHLPLKSLTLTNNPIDTEQLQFLHAMPLESLYIAESNIDSLDALASHTSLRHLGIHYTSVQDLSVLRQLPELEWLTSYGTHVMDLTPLLESNLRHGYYLSVGGCLKLSGFSRSQPVIDRLIEQGTHVQVYNWARPTTPCPNDDGIESLAVTADLSDDGLALSWQVTADDNGPWRCELHLDLEQQQARAPVAVLDDCHLQQSWRLPSVLPDRAKPTFILDTGLVAQTRRVDMAAVQSEQSSAIQLAGHDWLQAVVKSNPYLVPWRESVLRLHLVSNDAAVSVPEVSVHAELTTGSTDLQVEAPATLPAEREHQQLTSSYRVSVPASVMQPGLRLQVNIAGQQPLVIEPAFAKVNSIDLVLVPLQLGETVTTLPSNELVERSLMTTWPLAQVNITRREPFQLAENASSNTTSTMIREVNDLRIAEGGQGYYYGYFQSSINTDEWGGRGYMPGFTSVGLLPHGQVDMTLSHELGHNFGIQHAPCGSAEGTDPHFPYEQGGIGSWGVPLSFQQLLSPERYNDVMGYCGNRHVSDYNFEKVQDYLQDNLANAAIHLQPVADTTAPAAMVPAMVSSAATVQDDVVWYYRMALSTADTPEIQQMMQLPSQPDIRANSGYQVLAMYEHQAPQLWPVELLELGHGDAEPELAFAIPHYHEGQPLLQWELYQGNAVRYQSEPVTSDAVRAQAAVLIEERAGEVCVDAGTTRFDAMHLIWLDGAARRVVALNVQQTAFCRSAAMPTAGGQWQLQLRRGSQLQVIQKPR